MQHVHLPPLIGLGTFRCTGDTVRKSVKVAIDSGIRHIDTASIYKNEVEIGEALKECIREGIVSREDLYVTSKISPYEQGFEKALRACEKILERLDIGYVDLVLIHWPGVAKQQLQSTSNAGKRYETWQVMEQFYDKGLFKAIGVSNFEIDHLKGLLDTCRIKPMVNQIECHPKYPQDDVRSFCRDHSIQVVAYSCYGAGALFDKEKYPEVYEVAEKTGKTPAQILLCWGLEHGCCVLAKSEQEDRIREVAPNHPHMQPISTDESGRHYLNAEHDGILCSLSRSGIEKFCWDPSTVL